MNKVTYISAYSLLKYQTLNIKKQDVDSFDSFLIVDGPNGHTWAKTSSQDMWNVP